MNQFWADDITQLFSSLNIIPKEGESIGSKLNAITRLSLIVCVIIAFFKPVLAVSTILICLVIVMTAYYLRETKEKFSMNQLLVEGSNIKTKIPPIIAIPSHAWAKSLKPIQLRSDYFVSKSNIDQDYHNAFLDSTNQFRTELQERLMRKRNCEK